MNLRLYWGLRITVAAGVVAITVLGAVISYSHLYALGLALHATPLAAKLTPFMIDGAVGTGSVGRLAYEIENARRSLAGEPLIEVPGSLKVLLWGGIAITLLGNAAQSLPHGWESAAWAAVPAAMMAASFEALLRVFAMPSAAVPETAQEPAPESGETAQDEPEPGPEVPETPEPEVPEDVPAEHQKILDAFDGGTPVRQIERETGIDRRQVTALLRHYGRDTSANSRVRPRQPEDELALV